MKHHVQHVYKFNLGFARQLVADIPDEQMAEQPAGTVNHPAWVLGHLVVTADFMAALLGKQRDASDDWRKLFNPGSTPQADRSLYPSKDELVTALVAGHERVADAFERTKAKHLEALNPVEGFNKVFPTIGDALMYGVLAHEGFHLGQLSTWRRTLGFKNLLSQ